MLGGSAVEEDSSLPVGAYYPGLVGTRCWKTPVFTCGPEAWGPSGIALLGSAVADPVSLLFLEESVCGWVIAPVLGLVALAEPGAQL